MEIHLINKKNGSKIYLALMPRVSNYSEAKTLGEKVTDFLENHSDCVEDKQIDDLSQLLYKELGAKIQDIHKAKILAKILHTDYTKYKIM